MDVKLQDIPQFLNRIAQVPAEALRRSGPEFQIAAIANMRRDMTSGVSPDGAAYAPLRFSRPQGGNKPLMNRGILRASLSAEFTGETLFLRANAPGARLQQEGGTIVPTKGKALTIPLTVEAVRAGGARNFPRPLFVLRNSGSQNGVLAERVGKGKKARVVVHYLLRNRVQVDARPFLGLSKATAEDMATILNNKVQEIIAESMT
jgi:phage gpG-like protein